MKSGPRAGLRQERMLYTISHSLCIPRHIVAAVVKMIYDYDGDDVIPPSKPVHGGGGEVQELLQQRQPYNNNNEEYKGINE